MSSDMKFVGVIVTVAVLAIVGFVIFGRKSTPTDLAAHVEAATLQDAGQLTRPDSYRKGTDGAKVTLVEFGDYQCPACKAADPEVTALVKEYETRISFVFRHFPLPNHKFSQLAATAMEAAGAQGKYWEMHTLLYERQDQWSVLPTAKVVDTFVEYAKSFGLDTDKFRTAVTGRQFDDKIARDLADATALGVSKTPTFFVNGKEFQLTDLRKGLEEALK